MPRYSTDIDRIVLVGKKQVCLADYQLKLFWDKIKKQPSGCWEWQGRRCRKGYGMFRVERDYVENNVRAHRLMFALERGLIPNDLLVLHKCDNRCCVNPDHLWLGTDKDNADDREKKGRGNQLSGDRHPSRLRPETRPRGSAHGISKLTEPQVLEIRSRYAAKEKFQYELAKEYGVSQRLICVITRREGWKHI